MSHRTANILLHYVYLRAQGSLALSAYRAARAAATARSDAAVIGGRR